MIIVLTSFISGINNDLSFSNLLKEVSKNIVKRAIEKGAKDNLSCVFLCFDNLYKCFNTKNENELQNALDDIEMKENNNFEQLYDDIIDKKICDNFIIAEKTKANDTKKPKKGFFSCCGIFS